MQKGQKSEKVKAWEELGEWFANQGASKYLNYIRTLDGEEYAKRYEAMLEYFKTVHEPKDDVSLYITQSWANYTDPGQYHHKHAHPNSFISGVFYPQADRSVDKIYFYKSGYERIKVAPQNWNHWNSESWWFEVGAGDLILFPSNLEHMVETKVGNETRVSIAFNTFLKGHIGVDESLTGLQLGEE